MINYGIVYLLTNMVNGKRYVGQTTKGLDKRWTRYCWPSEATKRMPIVHAIRKYGMVNFERRVLEICASQEHLDDREKHWANDLNAFSPNGYNLRAGAGRGSVSEETRNKLRILNLGRKASKDARHRMSVSHLGNKMSKATKEKLSARWKGKRPCKLAQVNSIKANTKTYHLIDPFGRGTTVENMREHCRRFNLSPFKMCEVYKGRANHHRGWRRDPQRTRADGLHRIRRMAYWTKEMDTLLGKESDVVLAKQLGLTKNQVWTRRIRLGIPCARRYIRTELEKKPE